MSVISGVPAAFDQPIDRAEFRRPVARPGVELYRAHIVHHHFAPHFHDGYGLGVVEAGVERFRYRGREHVASAGSIVLMQPGELHTGGPAVPQGWRYRMLYLDEATLADQCQDGSPWRFAETVQQEPARATALARALGALWQAAERSGHDALAFDEALADALGLIAPLSAAGPGAKAVRTDPVAFRRVVECLRADLAREWRLADLAALAGLSPFHFQRTFKAHYQASPHQWRMALRLAEAKRRLARGEPAAEVAAAVGLADQAHLTRRFAGMYGVTPARYQRQLRAGRPARPAAPARRPLPSAPRG